MRWIWEGGASVEFEQRADAEAWLSEHWAEIDAVAVTLMDGDEVVYEMSLEEA